MTPSSDLESAPESPDQIGSGAKVQDTRNRSRHGTVVNGPFQLGGRTLWEVRWNDGRLMRQPEDLLELAVATTDLRTLLLHRKFGGVEDFVRSYTHQRLLTPVDDTLYSLRASRTRLLPHQFKPLVKFLDSLHRRYLIADEVGLGKTIEAGIILSELRARERLGNVLILCPSHLREKWHSEMMTRFDERFDIVTSRREWETRVVQASLDGVTGHRVIVGHKTLASRAVLDGLGEHAPVFDLLIVDEAHHFKNSKTLLRRVLGELADAAHQLLLLTATPLQTADDNLLSLLRLLDYTSFRGRSQFTSRLAVNSHLVRAERHLRAARPEQDRLVLAAQRAGEALAQISEHEKELFGLDITPQYVGLEDTLQQFVQGTHLPDLGSIADAATDLRELNLLAPYVTRTRKVEVQSTCRRTVESVRPELSIEEMVFYRAVVRWCRREIRQRHGERAVLFLSRNIERRVASSLHAFAGHLRASGVGWQTSLLANPPKSVREAAAQLRDDAKATRLVALLDEIRASRPDAKIIIFASFRNTLRYLSAILRRNSWDHEVIHGGVAMDPSDPDRDERGRRVRRFMDRNGCNVLLSSNIGGEGLDLQRASIVINYDLPWNPAVIEQRIGRVDRFGQESPVVRVMNFVLPGTVEDHIFTRLDERLHLFENTIGDFAEVLGRVVAQLSHDFLRDELTDAQQEEQAREAAWRLENQRRDLESVLDREHELVAYDDDFAEQLRNYERVGRTITPADLKRVVTGILARHYPESWLLPAAGEWAITSSDVDSAVHELYVDSRLRGLIQAQLHSRESVVLHRLLRKLVDRSAVLVAFDGETAELNPEIELITARHPLLRALLSEHAQTEYHKLAAVRIRGHNEQAGLLVLFAAEFQVGSHKRRFLRPVFVNDQGVTRGESAGFILRRALDFGEPFQTKHTAEGSELVAWLDRAEEAAMADLQAIVVRLMEREETRLRPRVAELTDRYRRRYERAMERRDAARDRDVSETERRDLVRRVDQYIRRLERERDNRIQEISTLPRPELSVHADAAVWLAYSDE